MINKHLLRLLAGVALAATVMGVSSTAAQAVSAPSAALASSDSAVSSDGSVTPSKPTQQAATAAAVHNGPFTNRTTRDGVHIRLCPSTSCGSSGLAYRSHLLTDTCYTAGQSIFGNIWWDRIYDRSTGKSGWVSEYYLQDKGQFRHC